MPASGQSVLLGQAAALPFPWHPWDFCQLHGALAVSGPPYPWLSNQVCHLGTVTLRWSLHLSFSNVFSSLGSGS